MSSPDSNDYFYRLANAIYFGLPDELARRIMVDDLAMAETVRSELADLRNLENSKTELPNLYELLPDQHAVETLRPIIDTFQRKWESEDPKRKGGLDAIHGAHIWELATTYDHVATERIRQRRRKNGCE